MKLFYCKDFKGHYPVGVSALVVEENINMAADSLTIRLCCVGLRQKIQPEQLVEVYLDHPQSIILNDGDY